MHYHIYFFMAIFLRLIPPAFPNPFFLGFFSPSPSTPSATSTSASPSSSDSNSVVAGESRGVLVFDLDLARSAA